MKKITVEQCVENVMRYIETQYYAGTASDFADSHKFYTTIADNCQATADAIESNIVKLLEKEEKK